MAWLLWTTIRWFLTKLNTALPPDAAISPPGQSVSQSVQLLSRVRLCDPMNRSTPGLPVHHQLPEFTQTRAHRVGDAIQPSHPLLSPSPPAPKEWKAETQTDICTPMFTAA